MRTIGGRRNRTNDCLGLGLQVALVDTVKARSQVGEVIRVATAGLAQHLMIVDLCKREKVGLNRSCRREFDILLTGKCSFLCHLVDVSAVGVLLSAEHDVHGTVVRQFDVIVVRACVHDRLVCDLTV